MKQAYLDLLAKVLEEHKNIITVDRNFMAILRLANVITKAENESFGHNEANDVKLLSLFEDVLPRKNDSAMEKLPSVLKIVGNEVVSSFLEEKIKAINDTPETLENSEVVEISSGPAHDDEAGADEDQTPGASRHQEMMIQKRLEALRRGMKKFFLGKNYTTIKVLTSDDIFRIQDMWVNLRMETPKGSLLSPVADYEKNLTDSLLENIPVIIRGKPWVGKSTLVKKLCHNWAVKSKKKESNNPNEQIQREPENFGVFDLVLPCRLHEAESADTIPEMVLQWVKNLVPALRSTIEPFLENSENLDNLFKYKILFILDGWDEYPKECEDLKNLLTFTRELQYSLLITTRPSEMERRDSRFRFYQIVGIEEEQEMNYIDKFSRAVGGNADIMKNQLNTKPQLKEITRLPLVLESFCAAETSLPQLSSASAKNTTELFTNVVRFILEWHIEKRRLNWELGPEDWQHDPRFHELGKLALKGLLEKDPEHQLSSSALRTSVFKECDLSTFPEMLKIGLLCRNTQHKLQQASYSFSFRHETFQDFFAALFIRSRLGKRESLSKSLEATETLEMPQLGQILKQTTAFLIGLTQEGEFEKLVETLKNNRLLSSFISETDQLDFNSENPILKECKDGKTAANICRMIFELYGAKEHERSVLSTDLTSKEIRFLLKSVLVDMRFESVGVRAPGKGPPSFPFLSNARGLTGKPESRLSCERLLIENRELKELKLLGYFKSFRALESSADKETLTPIGLTELINSCPKDVEEISLMGYSTNLDSDECLPSSQFLEITAKTHRQLKKLGLNKLSGRHPEHYLKVAAAFSDLATLRIYFSDYPSTDIIDETLIPALGGFKSLRTLMIGNLGEDEHASNKDLEKKIREKEMKIRVVDYYSDDSVFD